jgi:hypothetical protein
MNYMLVAGNVTNRQYRKPKWYLFQEGIRVTPFRLTTEQWSLSGLRAEELSRTYDATETSTQRETLRKARLPIIEGSSLCLPGSLLLEEFAEFGNASEAAVSAFVRSFSAENDRLVAVIISETLCFHRMTAAWQEVLLGIPWYKAIPNGQVEPF